MADAAASVRVVYPDGYAIPGATANGYFLAWAPPRGEILRAKGLEPKTVQLVAYDAAGAALGELEVGARTGSIPLAPGASPRAPSCG